MGEPSKKDKDKLPSAGTTIFETKDARVKDKTSKKKD
jgi:hypothetical protein